MQAATSTLDRIPGPDALSENEAQFRAIFEHSAVSIALLSTEGVILRCNAALAQLLGRSEAEMIGRNYLEAIHPQEAGVSAASFRDLMRGKGTPIQVERRLLRKDGQIVWARITTSLFSEPDAQAFAIAMIEDITQSRTLEGAVKEAAVQEGRRKENTLAKEFIVVGAIAAVVFVLGCQFNLFGSLFEITWRYRTSALSAVLGTIIVVTPVLAMLIYGLWKETQSQAGETLHIAEALQFRNKDLENRVQQRTAELLKGQAAIHTEVIERKHAEQASRENEERFRQLAQNIDQVFWIADSVKRQMVYVNPAYETIWGRSCESLLQNPGNWLDAVHPSDRNRVKQAMLTKEDLGDYDETYRIVRPDGGTRWIRDRSFPLRDAAGKVYRIVGTATDITETRLAEEELRKLSRAVQQSSSSIVITDRDGIIEYVNPKFTAVTGYTAQEVIGRTPRILKSGEMSALSYKDLWDTISSGNEWHGELYNRKKDGELFWESVSISPVTDAEGKILHYVAVKEDVTQRKQMIEAMRESEERFRAAVETAPDSIYLQIEGRFAYVNAMAVQLFGAPNSEALIGLPVIDRIHPDDQTSFRTRIHRLNELRQHAGLMEQRILKMDGSSVAVEVSAVPFSVGKKNGALVFARDITERHRAEERICEQAALLDKAHDAICVQDLSQKILYWNKGAERLYGWSAAEAVGTNAEQLLFNGDTSKPIEALCNLMREGEWRGELEQVDRNARKLVVESRWSLMRDKNWKPKSILIINTDVTEQKQTEAKFLRTQRMESLGALAGGIAHDLNNVLAPVMMAAEALVTENTTPDDRQLLDIIRNSAQRGSQMVKQILTFARGLGGEHQPLAVNHLIGEIEDFAKRTFPPTIQFRKTVAKDLHLVRGDATQIHQILLNLCVNARDAMPQGGVLSLEASNLDVDQSYPKRQASGPHVALTVSDTGHGIPSSMIDRIFEPFFTTKANGKGTGLGLSTVLGIVKTHGGFLDVSSEADKGTTFRVFLPAVRGAVQASERVTPTAPSGNGEVILVVDDNAAIRAMIKLSLEAHNYRVVPASDGGEALKLYEAENANVSAVVTDMLMPGMNGAQLILALRKFNPAVKVIGTTGQGSAEEVVKDAQTLVQGFLTKPFSTHSLLVKLNEILK
jgi:PAS domain S-box-containing protein